MCVCVFVHIISGVCVYRLVCWCVIMFECINGSVCVSFSPIAETISSSSSSSNSSRKKSVLVSANCHSPNTGQGQSPSNSSLVSVSVCEGYSVYVLNLEALLKLDSESVVPFLNIATFRFTESVLFLVSFLNIATFSPIV